MKYLRRLNAAKIGAALVALGTVVINPRDGESWAIALGTILAAVAGDKNSEADEQRRKDEEARRRAAAEAGI